MDNLKGAADLEPIATYSGLVEKLTWINEEENKTKASKILSVIKGRRKVWKKYYAILANRNLFLFKNKNSIRPEITINLARYHSCTKDDDRYVTKHCLRILSFGTEKIQYFLTLSEQDLKTWIEKIKPSLSKPQEDEQKFLELITIETDSITSSIQQRSLRDRLKSFGRKRLSLKKNRKDEIDNTSQLSINSVVAKDSDIEDNVQEILNGDENFIETASTESRTVSIDNIMTNSNVEWKRESKSSTYLMILFLIAGLVLLVQIKSFAYSKNQML